MSPLREGEIQRLLDNEAMSLSYWEVLIPSSVSPALSGARTKVLRLLFCLSLQTLDKFLVQWFGFWFP